MVSDVAAEFGARLKSARAEEDKKLEWMSAFHARLTALTNSYNNACNDVNVARIARSQIQARLDAVELQTRSLQQSVDDASFVLVLLDADADTYMNEYYLSADGGQKAALDLQSEVRDYFRKLDLGLARLPVVIRAFANADGMSRFLFQCGVVQSSGSLSEFAKEFSQASAMSDFVLVGHGKDRADKKIKGLFEQFIRNPTCRHVVFGACHDNGYVRMLEDFALDAAVVERVTLLYSSSVGKEFKKLPFRSTRLNRVFQATSSDDASSGNSVSSSKRAWDAEANPLFHTKRNCLAKEASHLPESLQEIPTWTESAIWVNAADQRVDSSLPESSTAALGCWSKVMKLKHCRAYHLNGNCHGSCGFLHDPLSKEEKLAFRKILRRQVCHVGLRCRDADCYYGHNCSCKKVKCKFPSNMHDVEQTTAELWRP